MIFLFCKTFIFYKFRDISFIHLFQLKHFKLLWKNKEFQNVIQINLKYFTLLPRITDWNNHWRLTIAINFCSWYYWQSSVNGPVCHLSALFCKVVQENQQWCLLTFYQKTHSFLYKSESQNCGVASGASKHQILL